MFEPDIQGPGSTQKVGRFAEFMGEKHVEIRRLRIDTEKSERAEKTE